MREFLWPVAMPKDQKACLSAASPSPVAARSVPTVKPERIDRDERFSGTWRSFYPNCRVSSRSSSAQKKTSQSPSSGIGYSFTITTSYPTAGNMSIPLTTF
jgi:hypothetical protein